MKKNNRLASTLIVIISAIVLFSIPKKTNGQAAILVFLFGDKVASENFYFSLKIGGNLTNVTNLENSKTRFGMNFGLLATIKLNNQFYVVPELSFLSLKGAKGITKQPTGNDDLDNVLINTEDGFLDLNYIDIPVLLKYYLSQKLNVGIGPYASYLTSASSFYETNLTGAGDIEVRQLTKDNFNRWDYGVMVEIAYAPSRTSNSDDMNFHLRFSYGFADIIKDNPGNSAHNYSIQGYISFPFMKGGE